MHIPDFAALDAVDRRCPGGCDAGIMAARALAHGRSKEKPLPSRL